MATTVDTLLVRIEADMSNIKRDLNSLQKDTLRSTTAAGAAFKNLGRVINVAAIGVIALSAARAGKAMIDLAGDVAEMQSKSSVVFGKFRNQVVSDLSEFGSQVGRSSHELEGMASSIQDTFVPMGFARGEAAKLSVDLTKLAVDVASFNNASDTETMEAFQSALVGNHETVRRFGVVITEATLKQELLRMGIKRTGDEVTNSEKVQARLNLILDGTTDAQGDAARTADSYANQTKALGAEVSELALDIGRELLPMATDLVELFRDGVGVTRSFLIAIGALAEFGRDAEGTAKRIQKLKEEVAFLEDPANARFFINEELKIDLINRTIEGLEAQLLAQQALAAQTMEDKTSTDADSGADNSESDFFSKEQKALAKQVILSRRKLVLDKELKQARQSGNQEAIKKAQLDRAMFDIQSKNDDLLESHIQRLLGVTVASGNYSSVTDTLTVALAHANAGLAMFDGTIDKADDHLKELKETIEAINEKPNQELIDNIADLEAHLSSAGPKIEGAELALEKLRMELLLQDPVISAFNDGVNKMADQLSDALADAALSGTLSLEDLGDAFKQTLREMLADAMRAQIIRPMLSSIFGGIGGAIGGPVGDFVSAIGQKSTGGPVIKGAPYIVGERGPELFVPQGAGSVVNAASTRGLGGGGGTVINQNFNVSTGVQQTVRNEIRQLMPQIADNTRAAVADAKRRGGSYGKAFA